MKSHKALWVIGVLAAGGVAYCVSQVTDREKLPSPELTFQLASPGLLEPADVDDMAFGPNDTYLLVSSGASPKLQIWDWRGKKLVAQFSTVDPGGMFSLGHNIAAAAGGRTIILIKSLDKEPKFEVLTKKKPRAADIEGFQYSSVALQSSGRKLAACGLTGTLELWDIERGSIVEVSEFRRLLHSSYWLDESRLIILAGPIPGEGGIYSEILLMDSAKKAIIAKTIVPRLEEGKILGTLDKDRAIIVGMKQIYVYSELRINGELIRHVGRPVSFPYIAVVDVRNMKIDQDYLVPDEGYLVHRACLDSQRQIVYYVTSFRTSPQATSKTVQYRLHLFDLRQMKPIREFSLSGFVGGVAVSNDGKFLALSVKGWFSTSAYIYAMDSILSKTNLEKKQE